MGHFEQTMRWFGPKDPVTLSQIRQAGATGVVTALHHLQPGQEWSAEAIAQHKARIEEEGLRWSVVESVPVHEDIKRQTGNWLDYLEAYRATLRNLGSAGVKVVCYNYMAVTDWTRTDLDMAMPSGARALRFDRVRLAVFDLHILKRPNAEADHPAQVQQRAAEYFRQMSTADKEQLTRTILLGLPGTVHNLTIEEFQSRLDGYRGWTKEALRDSLYRFLGEVAPVAQDSGVRLAIHPDDPPFPIFGLPRVAATETDFVDLLQAVDIPANGITFCSGSLGAHSENDLPGMLRRLGHRVYFLHLRSVKIEPDGSFFEDDHLSGSSDMVKIVQEAIALADRTNRSLPMRPDHGHVMEGDDRAETAYPGYSFMGRMRGLAELRGLELGLRNDRGRFPAD